MCITAVLCIAADIARENAAEGSALQWLRRTAVGESEGAGVGIKVGASVGVTMGVLVGSRATSAKSAGRLHSASILTETACASYCASCICAHHAYARSARGGDRVDKAQASAGYRIHAGVSTGAERRALGPNGSWQSVDGPETGGASARGFGTVGAAYRWSR